MSSSDTQQKLHNDECPICMEEMKKGETLITTDCGHRFHFSCIQQTIKTSTPTCPICRGEVKQLREAFLQNQQAAKPAQASSPIVASPALNNPYVSPQQQLNSPYGAPTQQQQSLQQSLQQSSFMPYGAVPPPSNIPFTASVPFTASLGGTSNASGKKACAAKLKYPKHDPVSKDALARARAAEKTKAIEGSPKLEISFALEYDQLAYKSVKQVFGTLNVTAPELVVEDNNDVADVERQALDILCVVDKSGSMSGSKIKLLRKTLQFVASQLQEDDRMAVVEFASRPTVLQGFKRMSDEGKKTTSSVIARLKAGGGTDIGFALCCGFEVLKRRKTRNPISSMLLLTDGQDSQTPRILNDLMADLPSGSSLHSFGFGSDHDAQTMNAIADASKGTFTYIEDFEDVGPAFARTLGGLMSICAVDIEARFEACEGFKIAELHTRYEKEISNEGKTGVIKIPDLFSGEARDLVFEITALARDDEVDVEQVLTGALAYQIPGDSEIVTVHASPLSVKRAKTDGADINLAVNQQRHRVATTDALKLAVELAQKGDLKAARETLDGVITDIEASPSAKEHLCVELLKDLKASKARLRDQNSAQAGGYAQMYAQANQHGWQRQTQSSTSNAYGYTPMQMANATNYSNFGV